MSYGGRSFRRALKMGAIINTLPETRGKSYQECNNEEKARMLMELAFHEVTGSTYTDQWFQENSKYL